MVGGTVCVDVCQESLFIIDHNLKYSFFTSSTIVLLLENSMG